MRPIIAIPLVVVVSLLGSAGGIALLIAHRLTTVAAPWGSADTTGAIICGGFITAFVFCVVGSVAAMVARRQLASDG